MNFNNPRHAWWRLTTAARQSPDERHVTAPYGFATRVAALAFAQELTMSSVVERVALRAFGVACLLAILSVAVNYKVLSGNGAPVAVTDEFALPADDAVAVVLDLTD
ncbi:MAG: hypothetical protein HY736_22860 [Verrucomicrobia bacterium]|nr:hypothetical protein [Verrucomicrobiota bacterium]